MMLLIVVNFRCARGVTISNGSGEGRRNLMVDPCYWDRSIRLHSDSRRELQPLTARRLDARESPAQIAGLDALSSVPDERHRARNHERTAGGGSGLRFSTGERLRPLLCRASRERAAQQEI